MHDEVIDAAAFVLRDLTDYALDVVQAGKPGVIEELVPYGETDTLCYRAEPDEALGVRQRAVWEPLLIAAETRWDVRFVRVAGVIHKQQPAETMARLREELGKLDAFTLAALRTTAALAASLTLGLVALEPGAVIDALWDAANLEEDWQAELWGKDAEAFERRVLRHAAFAAAARFGAELNGTCRAICDLVVSSRYEGTGRCRVETRMPTPTSRSARLRISRRATKNGA